MNIDELAHALRGLSALDCERLFDRMNSVEKYDIQRAAFSDELFELEDLREQSQWWSGQADEYQEEIEKLRDDVTELKDEKTELRSKLNEALHSIEVMEDDLAKA